MKSNEVSSKTVVAVAVVAAILLAAKIGGAAETTKTETGKAKAVNINTASASELSLLPGIGPSKAKAIVEFRARAPFKKAEEIKNVKGIGDKTFAKIAPFIILSGATTATAELKAPK